MPAAEAPRILEQPSSQSTVGPTDVTFTVAASGTAPLSYQWLRDGSPISGAIASSYALAAGSSDTGARFSVLITNAAGAALSTPALLTVAIGPVITAQPA